MARGWRKRVLGALIGLVGFGVMVGPWPIRGTADRWTGPLRVTVDRLQRTPVRTDHELIRAGVAEVSLDPPTPIPVAGFIDQIWQPFVAINSRCTARALTVASGSNAVTILTADLLLIDAALSRRILSRTGLLREQIFFTATHTHGGPGGWGNHPFERLVAGTYDPEMVDFLASRLTAVVLASRSKLEPVEVAFVRTMVGGMQVNRIAPGMPTNDHFSAWIFRPLGPTASPPLATFAVFGAHATIGHPKPGRLGGDYPAAFAAALRRGGQAGVVLFAAGTVGDASPVRPHRVNQQQSVEAYGGELASRLEPLLGRAEFRRETELVNLGFEVDLPPVEVPLILGKLQLSPLAVWWVGRPKTYLHALRLGPAVLAGFPGDLAGHLGSRFSGPTPIVATSFNGDYKGYLVSRATFRDHPESYEVRWMSFFGAGLGEYLVDLMQKGIGRILTDER